MNQIEIQYSPNLVISSESSESDLCEVAESIDQDKKHIIVHSRGEWHLRERVYLSLGSNIDHVFELIFEGKLSQRIVEFSNRGSGDPKKWMHKLNLAMLNEYEHGDITFSGSRIEVAKKIWQNKAEIILLFDQAEYFLDEIRREEKEDRFWIDFKGKLAHREAAEWLKSVRCRGSDRAANEMSSAMK